MTLSKTPGRLDHGAIDLHAPEEFGGDHLREQPSLSGQRADAMAKPRDVQADQAFV
jgi:hypothetical protein